MNADEARQIITDRIAAELYREYWTTLAQGTRDPFLLLPSYVECGPTVKQLWREKAERFLYATMLYPMVEKALAKEQR